MDLKGEILSCPITSLHYKQIERFGLVYKINWEDLVKRDTIPTHLRQPTSTLWELKLLYCLQYTSSYSLSTKCSNDSFYIERAHVRLLYSTPANVCSFESRTWNSIASLRPLIFKYDPAGYNDPEAFLHRLTLLANVRRRTVCVQTGSTLHWTKSG